MYFTTSNFVFFFMTFGMYFLMFVGGKLMKESKTDRGYWMASIIPICAFTLNMGLRWGRGTDYNNGYYDYERIINGIGSGEDYEPIWRFFHFIFGDILSFSWQLFVAFMSFFLILALVFYVKRYKRVLPLALPIFAEIAFPSENLIRWFCSFSFFLIGLFFLENKNRLKYLLFAGLAFFVHYGSITFTIPIFLLSYIKKPILHPIISITGFYLLYFLFETTDMLVFTGPLNALTIGGNLGSYQEGMEDWLTNTTGDFSAKLTGTALLISPVILYLGYKISKIRTELILPYNIMTIGLMLMPALIQIQLTYRICLIFYMFQFLFIPFIFYDVFSRQFFNSLFVKVLVVFMLLVYARTVVVTPFVKPENQTYYIWNAKGRKTL